MIHITEIWKNGKIKIYHINRIAAIDLYIKILNGKIEDKRLTIIIRECELTNICPN